MLLFLVGFGRGLGGDNQMEMVGIGRLVIGGEGLEGENWL